MKKNILRTSFVNIIYGFVIVFLLTYSYKGYSQLHTEATFNGRTINTALAVGATPGSAGVSSGAATYSIPIVVPPGTNGAAPSLAINYNSLGGDGNIGRGWSLSGLSIINRIGQARYYDNNITDIKLDTTDRFALDGVRLIALSSSGTYANSSSYATENEDFTRVTRNGTLGTGPTWFKVETKEGVVMEFGNTADSRVLNEAGTQVMFWQINKITQPDGNYITFTYTGTDRDYRISEINYTGNATANLAPYNKVKFEYIARSVPSTMYMGGSSLVNKYLLNKITVTTESNALVKSYNFTYASDTINQFLKEVSESGSQTSQNLNSTIFKYGNIDSNEFSINITNLPSGNLIESLSGDYDGDGISDIITATRVANNTSQIRYGNISNFKIWKRDQANNTYTLLAQESLTVPTIMPQTRTRGVKAINGLSPVDVNGDGKDDILALSVPYITASTSYHRLDNIIVYQTSSSGLTSSQIGTPATGGFSYSRLYPDSPFFQFADFDGDGKIEYLVIVGKNYQNTDPGTDYRNFIYKDQVGYTQVATYTNGFRQDWYKADDIHVLDFNGDGKSDLLLIWGTESEIFTFDSPGVVRSLYHSTTFPTSGHYLSFGDFNGDGKTDFLAGTVDQPAASFKMSSLSKAVSTGSGFIVQDISSTLNYGIEDISVSIGRDEITIGDFNGDGKADFFHDWGRSQYFPNPQGQGGDILRNTEGKYVYYSQGDSFVNNKVYYNSTEVIGGAGRLISMPNSIKNIAADVNGDGRTDILNNFGSGYWAYSFRPNGKELLLEKIKNGYNHVIQWSYDYLTKGTTFYSKGPVSSTYPLNIIQPALAAVASMASQDGVGGVFSSVNYTYEGARLHRGGRGFLGFSKVTAHNQTLGIRTISETQLHSTYYLPVPYRETSQLVATSETISQSTINGQFVPKGGKRYMYQINSNAALDGLSGVTTTTSNTYDSYGNVLTSTISNPTGTIVTTNSDYVARVTTVPRLPGKVLVTKTRTGQNSYSVRTDFDYTSIGQLLQKVNFANVSTKSTTTTFGYNNRGNLTSTIVAPAGVESRSTSAVYDSKGRYAEYSTNELGQTASATYDPKWGKPLTTTGINGLQTTIQYDAFGRNQSTLVPEGYTISQNYTWAVAGNQVYSTTVTHPGQPTEKTYVDVLGRTIKTETEAMNGGWITQTQQYDSRGNVVSSTQPYLSGETPLTTTTAYDAYNRPYSITHTALGTTTLVYAYQNGNLTVTTTKPGQTHNKVSTKTTDASGQTISVSDEGGTLTYTYYSHGKLKEVKNGANVVLTSSEYDEQANQTKLIDQNAGTTTYLYNSLGQLTSQTNAKAETHTLQYDKLGRVTHRIEPNSQGTTVYQYYTTNSSTNRSLNELEKITGFAGETWEYTYDGLGRVQTEKQTIDGAAYTTTLGYNAAGQVTTTTYGSGYGTIHHYNDKGYLTKITNSSQSVTLYQTGTLNGQGQLKTYNLGNGKSSTISYMNGFPTLFQTTGVQNLKLDWNYQTGNLNYRQDLIKNKKENFTYDNLDRLLTTQVEGLSQHSVNYATSGNINSKTDAGIYTYVSDKPNAVEGVNNPQSVIPSLQQDISYTSFQQPRKISENGYELDYTYGEKYERIKGILKKNGTTIYTRYYLGEYEKNNNKFIHYISSPAGLVAIVVRENNNDTYHYTYTDHLGSILTVTNASGTIEVDQNFDAWGRRRNTATWDYANVTACSSCDWLYRGYTGHEHLEEFGIINMNGRLYDPVLGRMLSADNFVQDPENTQSYNRYSYVLNNPLKYNDPTGQIWNFVIGAITGGISGYMIGKSQGLTGGHLFATILGGAIIGTLTAGIGTEIAAATVSWGTVGSGAITGAITGFIGGGFNAGLAGKDFLQGGVKGALWGASIGAGIGVLDTFISKHAEIHDPSVDFPGGNSVKPTDEALNDFSDKYFPNAREIYEETLKVANEKSLPNGYTFLKEQKLMYEVATGHWVNGLHLKPMFGKPTIWIAEGRFISDKNLFRTLGHEFIHSWHTKTTPLYKRLLDSYESKTESVAHNWSLVQGIRLGGSISSSLEHLTKYFRQLSDSGINWYYNNHWTNNLILNKYR